ncbi:hypothetical protein EJ04DRAFT_513533 [Polyplosphaeria fusca]|uniref:C2H2-type domain-containing protein n=1 Tax=Polyplosphaeria fusca TaxID=682080 RepID=A0A9P4UYB2_9PLEO|nr:hypothetical protein EJ04DRAFT_513533 [Polyplosphaeria fusca]
MSALLVAVVLLTLLLQPTAATSPFMDPALFEGPMQSSYPDPDGMLDAFCHACGSLFELCMCSQALVNANPPQRAPTFTEDMFLNHPDWPGEDNLTMFPGVVMDATHPQPEYMAERLPLQDKVLRQWNENATTVRPDTVQQHVADTYLPGDRLAHLAVRRQQRRHPPKEAGFVCSVSGCGKTYNRQCELNRHVKTHWSHEQRPHRCNTCNQGFLYPKDLNRHRKTHAPSALPAPKVYCAVAGCSQDSGFSRRDNLLRHYRNTHPGIAIPAA